jgi:glycine cleavage system H protein
MSELPADLMYTKSHAWVRDEGDDVFTVGITDIAQGLLGDLVFVELPSIGDAIEQGDECGVVESVKAASDVYAPLDGDIDAVNMILIHQPEHVNTDPYETGWLYRIHASDPSQFKHLLTADEYAEIIEEILV